VNELVERFELSVNVNASLLAMLRKLHALPDRGSNQLNLTRERAIQVLEILIETLSQCLRVKVGEIDGDTVVVTDHHTVVTLDGLRKSLADLNRHIVDPMLKPEVKIAKGGSSWRKRQMARALGDLVKVYGSVHGLKSDKAAATKLSRKLRARGFKWDDEDIDMGQLLRMRYP